MGFLKKGLSQLMGVYSHYYWEFYQYFNEFWWFQLGGLTEFRVLGMLMIWVEKCALIYINRETKYYRVVKFQNRNFINCNPLRGCLKSGIP